MDIILEGEDAIVADAVYAAAARTNWHSHARGQIIMVTSGCGLIRTRAGAGAVVRAGDVAYAAADEEHWHGAAPDCFVTYRSISLGETRTGEGVTDESFAAAWAAAAG